MSERYLIVVGDPVTAGGMALEGIAHISVECVDGLSRKLVCVGHAVHCDQCGRTHVAEGVPHFFANSPAAYDGCALACGHRMVSTLQRLISAKIDDTPRPVARSGHGSSHAVSHESTYDIRFELRDAVRNTPLTGVRYRITLDSGRVFAGTTDQSGLTGIAHACSPELATIEVLYDDGSQSHACADTCGC